MTNELVDAARDYLSAGLSIIALTGKTPNTFFHPNGLKTAMVGVPEGPEDERLIERVFTHPTTSGVAIVLPEHMVVVDIDGNEGAIALLAMLELDADHWLAQTDTPMAKTGRGAHLYYLSPNVHRTTILAEKLDLKGFGGYVAAPPSRHPDGGKYEWLDPLVDRESGARVRLDWLPDKIERYLKVREAIIEDKRVERAPYYELRNVGTTEHIVFQRVLAVPPIEYLAERVAAEPVGSGTGNKLLHWAACAAAEDGHTLQEAYAVLVPVVTERWAKPMAVRTARSTIRSGFKTVRGKV